MTCHHRVEAELASLNQRLDHLTSLVTNISSNQRSIGQHGETTEDLPIAVGGSVSAYESPNSGVVAFHDAKLIFSDDERAPFKLLGSRTMMEVLGLPSDLLSRLAVLERSSPPRPLNPAPRLFILGSKQATRYVDHSDGQFLSGRYSIAIGRWLHSRTMFTDGIRFSERAFQSITPEPSRIRFFRRHKQA